MAEHKLVVVGDSLSQGFLSGAISRADISYPVWVADAMGIRDDFVVPDFTAHGGLPLNLEQLLGKLSERYGVKINWWEIGPALVRAQMMLDDVEDYWERGRGSRPLSRRLAYHNLAVWGFQVRDVYTVTEGVCRAALRPPEDQAFAQVPEMAMYRTARRVLNSDFGSHAMEWSQMRCVEALAEDGGVENLVVALGANNALGTVTSLSIVRSTDQDLFRLPHERKCNLYLPDHFRQLYGELAKAIERIDAERVFLGTVPHVTIPPVTRGVSPDETFEDKYFEFYTRPWIWDGDFNKDKHPHLTRSEARQIDTFIDGYNEVIKEVADEHDNWFVFDFCELLDNIAFRRSQGTPKYKWPKGLIRALKQNERLKYLVKGRSQVLLDTRYIRGDADDPSRLEKGGLFSLDGIHPTTIGYGLASDLLINTMKQAGVDLPGAMDWEGLIRADTLINDPPALLVGLRDTLGFLDKRGLLSSLFNLFG